jgi:ribonuclease BN (tRNA processing enzyme)
MRVVILPSSPLDPTGLDFLTSFLIDDLLLIDAGSAGISLDLDAQARITNVFITHTHADHVLSLPMLVTNTIDRRGQPIVVHSTAPVLDSLRTDVFNGRLWPDFISMSENGRRFLELREVRPGEPTRIDGYVVTAVPVNHVVPTVGYIVENRASAVAFCSDTGPTDELWRVAARIPILRGVFLGSAFPNAMHELAGKSAHMTPRLLAEEVDKIPPSADIVAVHIKPQYRQRVIRELLALGIGRISVGEAGRPYEW